MQLFFLSAFLLTYAFLCGYNRLCMSKIVYEAEAISDYKTNIKKAVL